jgi:hypothetical protein
MDLKTASRKHRFHRVLNLAFNETGAKLPYREKFHKRFFRKYYQRGSANLWERIAKKDRPCEYGVKMFQ